MRSQKEMLAGSTSARSNLYSTRAHRDFQNGHCIDRRTPRQQRKGLTSSKRKVRARVAVQPTVCVTGVSEKNFEEEVIKVVCSAIPTALGIAYPVEQGAQHSRLQIISALTLFQVLCQGNSSSTRL